MHLLRHIFAPVRASGLKMLWSIIGVGVEIPAANYHFSIRALALANVGGPGITFSACACFGLSVFLLLCGVWVHQVLSPVLACGRSGFQTSLVPLVHMFQRVS
jgi:hypothetical protein